MYNGGRFKSSRQVEKEDKSRVRNPAFERNCMLEGVCAYCPENFLYRFAPAWRRAKFAAPANPCMPGA